MPTSCPSGSARTSTGSSVTAGSAAVATPRPAATASNEHATHPLLIFRTLSGPECFMGGRRSHTHAPASGKPPLAAPGGPPSVSAPIPA